LKKREEIGVILTMWNNINFYLLGNIPYLYIEIDGVDVIKMDDC